MRIFLFGATGGTGIQVLEKLLSAGHKVKALVRNPAALKVPAYAENLIIVTGNTYDPETYIGEMKGCDCVISVLGTGTSRDETVIYSKGGQHIIDSMKECGVKKLITLTSSAFDPMVPQYNHFIVKYIVRPLFKHIYADMQRWETILEASKDLDWICIRPSRLTNGKEKGNYRVRENFSPKGGWQISRKDLADFIVRQIGSDEFVHKKPSLAY